MLLLPEYRGLMLNPEIQIFFICVQHLINGTSYLQEKLCGMNYIVYFTETMLMLFFHHERRDVVVVGICIRQLSKLQTGDEIFYYVYVVSFKTPWEKSR